MSRFTFGKIGEIIASILYRILLYNVIGRRVKCYLGEIDLICIRGKQLVFVEVKARKCDIHEDIVSYKQQNRIRRAAELFLVRNPRYYGYNIRFDLVFIRPYAWPRIIRNAW